MAFQVPVICDNGRSRHSVLLDGGRLILQQHDAITAELVRLLQSDLRCCSILHHYQQGLFRATGKTKRFYIPSPIRSWAWLLYHATFHLYKLMPNILDGPLTVFLLLECKPLAGRLAFGLPPNAPLALWTPEPDPLTHTQWIVASDRLAGLAAHHLVIKYMGPDHLQHTLSPDTPDDHRDHVIDAVVTAVRETAARTVQLNFQVPTNHL